MKVQVSLFLLVLLGFQNLKATDTMRVRVDLTSLNKQSVAVEIIAPTINTNTVSFIIPKIIPGTYLQVDFINSYHHVKCFDIDNNPLKVSKRDNMFVIHEAKKLHRITYTVKHSFGGKRLWNNMIPCGGSVFLKSGFLINFQQVTGYFDGYSNIPIEVLIKHPLKLIGSTSQQLVSSKQDEDLFSVQNYEELIDRPIMYHMPDTASFFVNGTMFRVGVHNSLNQQSAVELKPILNKIMDSLALFMGSFSMKEYSFLFFFVDSSTLNWASKVLGLEAALEHRNSFVLTGESVKSFNDIKPYLHYITAHEFLHTWTPLNIRSSSMDPYDFTRPTNLSAHLWMYEGVTDYLASQFCNMYGFSTYDNFAYHIEASQNARPRSFANSSRHIAESNFFTFVSKIKQIGNAYSRGQVVSFCLDMEIIKQTNGQMNLHEVMLSMANDYSFGKPFNEDSLFVILSEKSGASIVPMLNNWIEGKYVPPYQSYLNLIGQKYIPKKQQIPSFGELNLKYDENNKRYYAAKPSINSLGLQAGDTLVNYRRSVYYKLMYPNHSSDTLVLKVVRNMEVIELTGMPSQKKKNKYTTVVDLASISNQQVQYRNWYNQKRKATLNPIN
jgi:predicted metalloprotease with PDZ domain